MRDLQFEAENNTNIVVSSPSTTSLNPAPQTGATNGPAQTKPAQSHPQKKLSSQVTPTKKISAHNKPQKQRTTSTSGIPSTSKSGSGNLYSPSAVTSPSHKQTTSGSNIGIGVTRPRGQTYTSGTKSQVLSPGGPSSGSLPSMPKGSNESVQSSSSREKKVTSPSRTARTNK